MPGKAFGTITLSFTSKPSNCYDMDSKLHRFSMTWSIWTCLDEQQDFNFNARWYNHCHYQVSIQATKIPKKHVKIQSCLLVEVN